MEGVNYPLGSHEESLALLASHRRRQIQFLTTLTLVNAIIQSSNGIISAMSESPAPSGQDALKKTLDELKLLLLPENEHSKHKRAEEVKEILRKEVEGGPLLARALDTDKKSRRRKH